MESRVITLKPDGIRIHTKPVILLTSSLFYFRIPRGLWQERMEQVKQAGYNAIDVYFPWNYHEIAEGKWHFTGERDVTVFLETAREEGLWVVARPGPYICSEWDGGGLPAYLFSKPGIRLRDCEPGYLDYVRGWYEHILPILSKFQITRGGTIVMVQLENELDFYDCQDRSGYIGALKSMALEQGIDVPLISCAGQGDLDASTGKVAGVIPTLNFYFENSDTGLEDRVLHYYKLLMTRGFPLCVTETNKSHFGLRRLLSAGAKMLGPYLQIGGTNFGFTNAVNNWGNPISFLTSDYDGGGMFTKNGRPRQEYYEGRLFTKLIKAMGEGIALAQPDGQVNVGWETTDQAGEIKPRALSLYGGGRLVSLPNVSSKSIEGKITVGDLVFPQHTKLTVASLCCPLYPCEIPLSSWEVPGKLVYATGELVLAKSNQDGATLVFCSDSEGELAFDFPGTVDIISRSFQECQEGNYHTLWFKPAMEKISQATIHLDNLKCIHIFALSRQNASLLDDLDPSGQLVFSKSPTAHLNNGLQISWKAAEVNGRDPLWSKQPVECGREPKLLEEMGILRGYGWYHSRLDDISLLKGLFLRDAADVISVWLGDHYYGTYTPSGSDLYIPIANSKELTDGNTIAIRAEIWGHSNFDDKRLPAMQIRSMRGISGAAAITCIRDLKANWTYQSGTLTPAGSDRPEWPLLNLGTWFSNDRPVQGVYHKWITPDPCMDMHIISFQYLRADAWVYLNGRLVNKVTSSNPYIDISCILGQKIRSRLSIAVQRGDDQPAGQISLLEGVSIKDWCLSAFDETRLYQLSEQLQPESKEITLPYPLKPGQVALLYGTFESDPAETVGIEAIIGGKNIKITAFLNGRLISRLWLPSANRPPMVGGEDNVIFLPGPWMASGLNKLSLMVECISINESGELTEFKL